MRKLIWLLFLPALYGADPQPCDTPEKCWTLLEQGNVHWKAGSLTHPNQTVARRRAVSEHQAPFAVVLTCSDSRVPPEVVFDRGVGDLFVVRVAGNVLDDHAVGSIQYAVEVREYTKLIVVLGHQRCGAVEAAVHPPPKPLPKPLATLIKALRPAVRASRNWPGDKVENAVDANVHLVGEQLAIKFPKAVVKTKRYWLGEPEPPDPNGGMVTEAKWIKP